MAPKHVFGTLICFFLASQPVFSDVSFVYEGTDTRAWCNFQSCSAQKDYNIVVGQNLDVNISATSNQTSLSNVTMTLLNIAGLPNGCQIFEEFHLASYIMDYTLNETVVHWYTMRRVLFTPRAGQEGLSYQVCFMASNSNITSTSMCFHIHVVAPVVQFLPTLPNSSFEVRSFNDRYGCCHLSSSLRSESTVHFFCIFSRSMLVGMDIVWECLPERLQIRPRRLCHGERNFVVWEQ
mmetsp:Transcript_2962/g.7130  ORF Transcript_2962/g.7130 Transcript_2962/m.7130 type:complete len:236 (-) Transcript_2962:730-1437(-)